MEATKTIAESHIQEEEKLLLSVLLPDFDNEEVTDECEVESYCLCSAASDGTISDDEDVQEIDFQSFADEAVRSPAQEIPIHDAVELHAPATLSSAPDATTADPDDASLTLTSLNRKLDIIVANMPSLSISYPEIERLKLELETQGRLLATERARTARLEIDLQLELQQSRVNASTIHDMGVKFEAFAKNTEELTSKLEVERQERQAMMMSIGGLTAKFGAALEATQAQAVEERRALEIRVLTVKGLNAKLEADLGNARADVVGLTAELRAAEEKETSLKSTIVGLQGELKESRTHSSKAAEQGHDESGVYGEQLATLGRTNGDLAAENARLKAELQEALSVAVRDEKTHFSVIKQRDGQIQAMSTDLTLKVQALETAEEEVKGRDVKIAALKSSLGSERVTSLARDVELHRLSQACAKEKHAVQALRRRENDLNTEVAALRTDLEGARASLSGLEKDKSALEGKLKSWERKYARMREEKESRLEALAQATESERARRQKCEDQIRVAEEKHTRVVNDLKLQFSDLETSHSEMKAADERHKKRARKLEQTVKLLEGQLNAAKERV